MEWFCALGLCLLVSLSSAVSPPKIPEPKLIPLNCNETEAQVGLAVDLLNEDRDNGFVVRPVRVQSAFVQQIEEVAGSSVYYFDVNVIETKCHVLSEKKWKDCNTETPLHELIQGDCKIVYYLSKPWRKIELLKYSCSLGPVPSSTIVHTCPDCPLIVNEITDEIKAKAKRLVEEFNKDSNQTHHFKLDEIERVRAQWVSGWSHYFAFTIKETECVKTQAEVNLDNCNSRKDNEAHVAFCTGSSYQSPDKEEHFKVSCEVYEPRGDDQEPHHHTHRNCNHRHEGENTDQTQAAGEAEASAPDKKEGSKDGKCGLDKGKSCGHEHRCRPGRRHHHRHRHPHHGHCHHCHHHHHNHSHPHHHHHHHDHNHTSSSEESTGQKPSEDRSKGSFQIYYFSGDERNLPVPTIPHLQPWKYVPNPAQFPTEPSPLTTCPSGPISDLPPMTKDFLFESKSEKSDKHV